MRERSDRRVDGGDWDDAVRGFLLHAWDHIPCHSGSVLGFYFQEFCHFGILNSFFFVCYCVLCVFKFEFVFGYRFVLLCSCDDV